MIRNRIIKTYFSIFIIIVLSTQQLKTIDVSFDAKHVIGTAALIGTFGYGTYLYFNQLPFITIPHAATSTIKSIIFDIDGVLSTTNKLRAFYEVGIPVTLWEIADQMQLPCEKILFDALAGVPAISTQRSYNKGLVMPQIMIDWQAGIQNLPAIRRAITDYLATTNKPESIKNWVLNTAMMMTDPAVFIATRQIIPANITLLQELKEKDYKLYILSNWDPISFPLFKKQFPEIFMYKGKELFDGIMISGNVGIVKPEAAVFRKCLQNFKLTPETSLFIDDEPANVIAAQQLNIKTILCNPHDSKALRDHLIDQLKS